MLDPVWFCPTCKKMQRLPDAPVGQYTIYYCADCDDSRLHKLNVSTKPMLIQLNQEDYTEKC